MANNAKPAVSQRHRYRTLGHLWCTGHLQQQQQQQQQHDQKEANEALASNGTFYLLLYAPDYWVHRYTHPARQTTASDACRSTAAALQVTDDGTPLHMRGRNQAAHFGD
jgi:hypothetical protein